MTPELSDEERRKQFAEQADGSYMANHVRPLGIERVGYRRLYRVQGVTIADREACQVTCTMGDVQVEVYIGPKPTLGVYVQAGDKYIVLGEDATLTRVKFDKDATRLPEAGTFFTEIRCSLQVEVPADLSGKFREQDPHALAALLEEVAKHGDELREAANIAAGVIGLRFHRQLVLELVDTIPYAERSEDDTPSSFSSDAAEILDSITLRPEGIELLKQTLTGVGSAPSVARAHAEVALRWLVLAWEDRVPASKFLSLFIPLERVLDGVTGDPDAQHARDERAAELLQLVQTHGGERRAVLIEALTRLTRNDRPSLTERFIQLSREAQLPGWEQDIKAFRRFNFVRNRLLHRGSAAIDLSAGDALAKDDEKQTLEDLVERYVNWAYFRDGIVYPSRWRRGPKIESPPAPQ